MKNISFETQGQMFSTESRGKATDNFCLSDKNNASLQQICGFGTNFSEKMPLFYEKTCYFDHRVDDSKKNQDLIEGNTTKTHKSIGFAPISSSVDPILTPKSSENPDSTGILADFEQNSSTLDNNSPKEGKNPDTTEKIQQNQVMDSSFDKKCAENLEKSTEKEQKSQISPSFEGQIDRDYKDFTKIYPNVSKESLLQDQQLRSFAFGKENQSFSAVYKDYCSLISAIESRVFKESLHRLSIESATVGALSSAKSSDDGYFSREQVQRMSPEEIRRNYKRIRESQQRW